MLQKPSHQCALVVTTMTHKPGKKQVLGWFPFLSPSFRLVCRPAAGHSPSASCYPLHLSSRSDWSPQVMSPISGQVYHHCAEWILRKTILFSDVECTHLKKKNLIKSIKESYIHMSELPTKNHNFTLAQLLNTPGILHSAWHHQPQHPGRATVAPGIVAWCVEFRGVAILARPALMEKKELDKVGIPRNSWVKEWLLSINKIINLNIFKHKYDDDDDDDLQNVIYFCNIHLMLYKVTVLSVTCP